jgi:hypothetical protein
MTIEYNNLCKVNGCNNQAEVKQLCKYHYWNQLRNNSKEKAKHKKIKYKKYLKLASKVLNAVSERGKEKTKLYKKARLEYLESHKCCEAKLTGCTIPTVDYESVGLQIHHKKGRVGELLFDKRYFLAVCQNCHNYIEQNVDFAISNGFSLSRLAKDIDL